VEEVLIQGAPLGVRTLDPKDNQYNGNYTNTDGTDYKTAGGFNYHNGPEWVWPLGYFLEAQIHFFKYSQSHTGEFPAGHMVYRFLRHHHTNIAKSHYRGLPELTNAGGAFCAASCEVQAWSSATILSALHLLHKYHQ
jgi:glycogen debranching enzyme